MCHINSPIELICPIFKLRLWLLSFSTAIMIALIGSSSATGGEAYSIQKADGRSIGRVLPETEQPGTPTVVNRNGLDGIGQPLREWGPFVPYSTSSSRLSSRPTFRLRGRIEADSIWSNQGALNEATFGHLNNASGLRRARIGAEGNFTPNSRYIGEIELASGQVVIRDLFAGLGDVKKTGEFKFGHMREPFSLEGGTSSNTFAFLERSPINDLDPARNWGVGFAKCSANEDSTIAFGVFKSGTDPNDFQNGFGSDTAATARWTTLIWDEVEGDGLMHVGFAASSRFPDHQVVVINQRPRSPLLDLGDSSASPFVSKIQIPATFEQLLNAQWAYVAGPFWTQAEWYGSLINQTDGRCLFYHGSYLAGGYFLTGEHRAYEKRNGAFGPVTVARPLLRGFSSHPDSHPQGRGAWEVTARASYLDFSDPNTQTVSQGPFVGTKLPQLTLGLNWYLADRLRIMFNYEYSAPEVSNTGTSSANVFTSRLAMFW